MRFRAPLGHSDFQKLRGANATYVDKTSLVVDILDDPHEVLLLPRPRRFGKTLNLSTLRAFLERTDDDRTDLFEGLEVWRSEEARRHFQRYPVVFLTFKDVKAHTFDDCLAGVRALVGQEVLRHSRALDQAGLEGLEAEACRQLRDGRADKVTLWSSLRHLTAWLSRATGERAVVLIDEYDMPIHAGYSHGYYDEATEFFRNFLSGGLKDNPHLFREEWECQREAGKGLANIRHVQSRRVPGSSVRAGECKRYSWCVPHDPLPGSRALGNGATDGGPAAAVLGPAAELTPGFRPDAATPPAPLGGGSTCDPPPYLPPVGGGAVVWAGQVGRTGKTRSGGSLAAFVVHRPCAQPW